MKLNPTITLELKFFQKTSSKLFLIGFALAVLTAFAYWPVKNYGFIALDDQLYVTDNAHVQQGLNLDGVKWAFTALETLWHPLTWISHMLDWELYGRNAGGHHLTSLIFHILSSVLLFLWLYRVTRAPWRSAFVAGLFALHPLRVESVAWVAERKDVLSTFFWMLTLHAYTSYVENLSRNAKGWIGKYVLALLVFTLGLMAKPMLVTMPFVFWLLDFWPFRRFSFESKLNGGQSGMRRIILEKVPFFLLSAAASTVTLWLHKTNVGVATATEFSTLASRAANAVVSYLRYVEKMFWPANLAVGYPPEILPTWEIAVAIAFLILMTALVIRLRSSHSYLAVGWFWYLGTLVPVMGLVNFGAQAMADRFTYVPLIGLSLMATWGAADCFRNSRARMMLASTTIVILGLCVGLTRGQVAHWKNNETLAEHGLRSAKHNCLLLNLLAIVRVEQSRFNEAIALSSESLQIAPDYIGSLWVLSIALYEAGRHDEAIAAIRKAVELNPTDATLQNKLGLFLQKQRSWDEAILHLKAALKSRPEFPEAHYNLGNTYFEKGLIAEAISEYEDAVRLQADYADAQCNLGMALLKIGQTEAGRSHIETAIRLNPNLALAHHFLSEILFQAGRFAEAEAEARKAVQLEPQPLIQYQLALALDAQKKWAEAEPILTNVLEAAKRAGDQRLANEITQRLASDRNQ